MIEKLKANLVPALIHVGYSLVYILFILPFDCWVKASERLAQQRANGSLQITRINSPWPFLSFVKSLILEFVFDFVSFLSYFVGVLFAFYTFFSDLSKEYTTFGMAFGEFLLVLIASYYYPILMTVLRDIFQLLILPLRKLISWCRKPAQYYDLNITK